MDKRIVILGGGVAGISAAVQCISEGYTPLILEKNRYLGGRVRSFHAADLNCTLDNGQHAFSSAYLETRRLLEKLGTLEKVHFQEKFEARFIWNSGHELHFRPASVPAPLHFFIPLWQNSRTTGIPVTDFYHYLRTAAFLNERELRRMTVVQWLDHCRQSSAIRQLLWYPLTLSIMNTPPEQASAYLLKTTVANSFLNSAKRSGLGIPAAWLSEIFADPAQAYIQDNRGEIHYFTEVHSLQPLRNGHILIQTQKASLEAPRVISTLPPFALQDVLRNSRLHRLSDLQNALSEIAYHPIMTINIFLEKALPGFFPAVLIGSPLQWIFAHPKNSVGPAGHGYALVVSAADSWIESSREEIITMVKNELMRNFKMDGPQDSFIKRYKIIKEKRATISQTPAMLTAQPHPLTLLRNFYLAGDWVYTGFPATIEGAVSSGRRAVEFLLGRN